MLKEDMPTNVQEVYITPIRLKLEKRGSAPKENKSTKHVEQRKNIKTYKRKRPSMYKGSQTDILELHLISQ